MQSKLYKAFTACTWLRTARCPMTRFRLEFLNINGWMDKVARVLTSLHLESDWSGFKLRGRCCQLSCPSLQSRWFWQQLVHSIQVTAVESCKFQASCHKLTDRRITNNTSCTFPAISVDDTFEVCSTNDQVPNKFAINLQLNLTWMPSSFDHRRSKVCLKEDVFLQLKRSPDEGTI